ncbi:MAG: serine/threonine-protein kinase [Archangium sp.]
MDQTPGADGLQPIEFGKYRLIRRIAVGGMAQIWLAVQRGPHGFEKTAVLKVILPELCSNDEFVQMFLDEARLAATLDHNNVVRIYDFGEVGGQYYLAMEHLPGEDLASIMQASKRAERMVPIATACDVIVGAATGLHFAHELTDQNGRPQNVVHRDVSPSNVIVTYHGTVKLVDFGIARAESNITKTAAGTLKGKVAYVSPEQAAGDPLDRRSDVFALGTVLYELVTLQRPFKRESDLATLKAVVSAPIPVPSSIRPQVPPALDAIILKAMERDLEQRYQSAAELADALASFLVSQQYVRSERAVAEFMNGLFDADRRMGKLRIAQISLEPSAKTPSQLKHLPQHLSPIRSHPTLPAAELAPAPSPLGAPEVTASGSSIPVVEGIPTQVGEPTLARMQRERKARAAIAVGVGIVLLVGVAYLVTHLPSSEEPKKEPVIAKVVPPPVVVKEPVKEPPPVPTAAVDAGLAAETPKPVEPPKTDQPVKTPVKIAKGKLTLDTTPYTEVFLKGRKLGDTPLVEVTLPPGIHVLTLVNDAKGIKRAIEVEISAGKTTTKKLKL